MPDYRIIITPDAICDLTELRDYIAYVLLAPDTALAYIQTIRREIGGLARMPARHKCVDQEPWHSRGVRKIIVKNFLCVLPNRRSGRHRLCSQCNLRQARSAESPRAHAAG